MRLFTALSFSEDVKHVLSARCQEIKKHTVKASFTEKNNLHMTLVFIGECDTARGDCVIAAAEKSAEEIKDAYAGRISGAVKAEIAGLGSFPREREHLVWAGLTSEPRNIFSDLHRCLIANLDLHGIGIKVSESRFTPHITLARRVIFREMTAKKLPEIEFAPIRTEIKSLCVMESVNMGKIYRTVREFDFV